MRTAILLACLLLSSLALTAPVTASESEAPDMPCRTDANESTTTITCLEKVAPASCTTKTGPSFFMTGGWVSCSLPVSCMALGPIAPDFGFIYGDANSCGSTAGTRPEAASSCRFGDMQMDLSSATFGCDIGNILGLGGASCTVYHGTAVVVLCTLDMNCPVNDFHTDGRPLGAVNEDCTFAVWALKPTAGCQFPRQDLYVECTLPGNQLVQGVACGVRVTQFTPQGEIIASCGFDANCFTVLWGYDLGTVAVGGSGCSGGAVIDPDACPFDDQLTLLSMCASSDAPVTCSRIPSQYGTGALCRTPLPCGRHIDTFYVGPTVLIVNTCRVGAGVTV